MTNRRPSEKWVPSDIQQHLDEDALAVLALGERIDEWYAPWLDRLNLIDAYDAPAILSWRNEAIEDAHRKFGFASPISTIATTAVGSLKVLQEPCPAYHAIREGARFRDALSSVAARVAHSDELWELMCSRFNAETISQVVECALLDLISSRFGNVEQAFWIAADKLNRVHFGQGLTTGLQEFINRLPPAKSKPRALLRVCQRDFNRQRPCSAWCRKLTLAQPQRMSAPSRKPATTPRFRTCPGLPGRWTFAPRFGIVAP